MKSFSIGPAVNCLSTLDAIAATAPHLSDSTRERPTTSMRLSSKSGAEAELLLLQRPDGQIAYTDMGTGPLVMMVPGLGDLKSEYRFLAPRVAAAGYRVVTMDLRGHGASSPRWPDYSCAALGGDVAALIKTLEAGPAFLVGTSMGAGAVAWAAAQAPTDVSGLVLIGPFVREIPSTSWLKTLLQRVIVATAFTGPWGPSAWSAYYASLYPAAKPADFDTYRADLAANLREPGRMTALNAMIAANKTDVEIRLHKVRAPTLVVMGSKDPDFPDPAAEAKIVAKLLGGAVQMIEGAGHYPHAEMPDIAAPAIIEFVNDHART
jgi:pimeloyl-ACP methyl ester carboxylesterase